MESTTSTTFLNVQSHSDIGTVYEQTLRSQSWDTAPEEKIMVSLLHT